MLFDSMLYYKFEHQSQSKLAFWAELSIYSNLHKLALILSNGRKFKKIYFYE